MPAQSALAHQKALGAFYTDAAVVRFLVGWGVRGEACSVMDPSCGDGRFLAEARRQGASRLVGCDVAAEALAETRGLLGAGDGVELIRGDFFRLPPGEVAAVRAVLGNPPFIRYQRFDQESRRRALESALRVGVRLTRLTSTWAPFLLHALQFLEHGGRLGMVVPAEITRTHYGLRTLRGLLPHFGSVRLLAFERNFFPDAQTETCLLLADDHGGSSDSVNLLPLESIADLERLGLDGRSAGVAKDAAAGGGVTIAMDRSGIVRFAEAYLTPDQRRSWRRAAHRREVRSLGNLGRVVNGYVTGDNEFFHRTREAARAEGLPATWLFPTVRNSRSLRGLSFTAADLQALEQQGVGHQLVVPQEDLFLVASRADLARFVAAGEARGTATRFKCRSRNPWWRVPGLQRADVVVAYMAGRDLKASVNEAGAVFTNALHGLKLRQDVPPALVALGFCTSLTRLSLEIEGRSYGGGILKLEPRELDRVLVPWPSLDPGELQAFSRKVDLLLRDGRDPEAVSLADETLLRRGLGWPAKTIRSLREARDRLMERRIRRSG